MQQASNVLLSPVDFSAYEISTNKRTISFSKKFPPNFRGYPCGTILHQKIQLHADPHELCIPDAVINDNKARVCVLTRREEGKQYKSGTIPMNVS